MRRALLRLAVVAASVGLRSALFGTDQAVDENSVVAAVGFSPYPGYTGSLRVSGSAYIVGESQGHQTLQYYLLGVDSACGTGEYIRVRNACAVHVHEGTSCEDAGGQHIRTAGPSQESAQPSIRYAAIDRIAKQLSDLPLSYDFRDIDGRTLVVYDVTGARVACSALRLVQVSNKHGVDLVGWQRYPGYVGDIDVQGVVAMQQVSLGSDVGQVMMLGLFGVDPACVSADNAAVPSACGVHLHEGRSCLSVEDIGGRLWNKDAHGEDPWPAVRYNVAPDGLAYGTTVPIMTGFDISSIIGRPLVVYDSLGAPIACTTVPEVSEDESDGIFP